jgi:ribosomal protein S6--L-glutamate ligase
MKIAILSRNPQCYSTRRLVEACEQANHEVDVRDYLRCTMDIASGRPRVFHQGEPVEADAIIPRIGASYTFYGTAVVRQFEAAGILTANLSDAINRSRDKLRCLQLLSQEGVETPLTGFAHDIRDINALLKTVGGTPVVIKLLEGTQGKGVVLAETKKAAESVITAFRQLDANILVQEYIKEAAGCDIRAFVVGQGIVGAMERKAAPGEFRANLHLGGTAKPLELSKEERRMALRAARVMGLAVAGVDLIRSERGPLVLEVNSSPGLAGIEMVTGKNIARRIIKYLEVQKEKQPQRRRRSS